MMHDLDTPKQTHKQQTHNTNNEDHGSMFLKLGSNLERKYTIARYAARSFSACSCNCAHCRLVISFVSAQLVRFRFSTDFNFNLLLLVMVSKAIYIG
eukprot:m.303502 g.303502  ORF g.303502 m.303502 type:complete len:97 (+) comp15893_c0_seq9:2742-3032(+)